MRAGGAPAGADDPSRHRWPSRHGTLPSWRAPDREVTVNKRLRFLRRGRFLYRSFTKPSAGMNHINGLRRQGLNPAKQARPGRNPALLPASDPKTVRMEADNAGIFDDRAVAAELRRGRQRQFRAHHGSDPDRAVAVGRLCREPGAALQRQIQPRPCAGCRRHLDGAGYHHGQDRTRGCARAGRSLPQGQQRSGTRSQRPARSRQAGRRPVRTIPSRRRPMSMSTSSFRCSGRATRSVSATSRRRSIPTRRSKSR